MTEALHTSVGDTETGSPPRKSLICVIDDDFDVLKSLRFLLETEGFDVRTFRSGAALLGSHARYEADCLIVDYKMAGIDGIELVHKLLLAKAGLAGVRDVLLKPHLEDSLVATVRNALNPSRAAD